MITVADKCNHQDSCGQNASQAADNTRQAALDAAEACRPERIPTMLARRMTHEGPAGVAAAGAGGAGGTCSAAAGARAAGGAAAAAAALVLVGPGPWTGAGAGARSSPASGGAFAGATGGAGVGAGACNAKQPIDITFEDHRLLVAGVKPAC